MVRRAILRDHGVCGVESERISILRTTRTIAIFCRQRVSVLEAVQGHREGGEG
jgi:hypothetical protein